MEPKELRYSRDHEWVALEGGVVTVGITDYAQKELGDIVFVDPPEVGRQADAGDEIATIESVKAVAEIFAPLAGEVTEVNEALGDTPETVNQEPYGEGWLFRLRPADPAEVEGLMDLETYTAFCEQESS